MSSAPATVSVPLSSEDMLQLAWLCEMAAIGCLHTNRSAWASRLRLDAIKARATADLLRGGR